MHRTKHAIPARILQPQQHAEEMQTVKDQENRHSRGKPMVKRAIQPPTQKIASDGEMEFAMHQILFKLNTEKPNYYTLAFEGSRIWTIMGSRIEYIEVHLSRCRTRITIHMIGPTPTTILCLTQVDKTVLEVVHVGFVMLMKLVRESKLRDTAPN